MQWTPVARAPHGAREIGSAATLAAGTVLSVRPVHASVAHGRTRTFHAGCGALAVCRWTRGARGRRQALEPGGRVAWCYTARLGPRRFASPERIRAGA